MYVYLIVLYTYLLLSIATGNDPGFLTKDFDGFADAIIRQRISTYQVAVFQTTNSNGSDDVPVIQEVFDDGKVVQINIRGRFDYTLSQAFRNAYRQIPDQHGIAFHVNLSDADYMDSSALGMMLLLREHAKCRGGSVIIKNPSEPVNKILLVANFEHLFHIS